MATLTAERELVSVEDYLKKEARSEVKHEYLAGMVYAMAGASEAHNVIAMNLYTALGNRLRGKICQPFGSDMKLKLHPLRGDICCYYPDAMVACDAADSGHGWRERPSVLIDVHSTSQMSTFGAAGQNRKFSNQTIRQEGLSSTLSSIVLTGKVSKNFAIALCRSSR